MEKRIMNQKELIDKVAEMMDVTKKSVREMLEALEAVLYEELATATEDEAVEVKVIRGLSLLASHVEEHTSRNPKTGESVVVAAKNKVRARIGKNLKEAIE